MVKLEQYQKSEWDADIVSVSEIPLGEHLGERMEAFRAAMRKPDSKAVAKWNKQDFEDYKTHRLARKVLVIAYKIGELERDEWVTIPQTSGYAKSNLKLIISNNPDLPGDTADWPGHVILVQLDKNGYYELAK